MYPKCMLYAFQPSWFNHLNDIRIEWIQEEAQNKFHVLTHEDRIQLDIQWRQGGKYETQQVTCPSK
jgi:hypothetical protein